METVCLRVCYRGLGLMPFVYLARGQAAAASARADVCVLTPARSSPANQSRLHSAISLPTAHHTTPRPELSSPQNQPHLAAKGDCRMYKISQPAEQGKRDLRIGNSRFPVFSCQRHILHLLSVPAVYARICVYGGGFIRLCVLRSSQGPLICLDQIKVVRDDKSCLRPSA